MYVCLRSKHQFSVLVFDLRVPELRECVGAPCQSSVSEFL